MTAVRPQLSAPRSLAIAHAFVAGGLVSDSERALEVGGTGAVDAELFDGFSYSALGHLHRPQEITKPTLRYSGTPLAYSFSEQHQKSVTVIDMTPDGQCAIDTIDVPVGRAVATITGTIDELLAPDAHPAARDCFVRAIVTDRDTVIEAKARLEAIYPHIIEVRLEPVGGITLNDEAVPNIADVDPIDAVRTFWTEVEGNAPDDDTDAVLIEAVTVGLRGAQ